jgi:YHS domain-containing protein
MRVKVSADKTVSEAAVALQAAVEEGKTYYFCSESCKARFVAKPTDYVE